MLLRPATGLHFLAESLRQHASTEQFRPELTAALNRCAEASGGAGGIVTAEDVDAARGRAQEEDMAALNAARVDRDRLAAALDRAETATAVAFAQAETRSAEHVHDNIAALRTEMDMLSAAGEYRSNAGSAFRSNWPEPYPSRPPVASTPWPAAASLSPPCSPATPKPRTKLCEFSVRQPYR